MRVTLAPLIACSWLASCTPDPGGAAGSRETRIQGPVPVTVEQLKAEIARPGAGATLVNVWATWCAPCREEFPDLLRLYRTYRNHGLRVVLVSADFEDQAAEARRFLAQQGAGFRTFLKTGDDQRFIEGLDPRWSGALPATWLYDAQGALRYFHEGRTTFDTLEPMVLAALGDTTSLMKEPAP